MIGSGRVLAAVVIGLAAGQAMAQPAACPARPMEVVKSRGGTIQYVGTVAGISELCRQVRADGTGDYYFGVWRSDWPGAGQAYPVMREVVRGKQGTRLSFITRSVPGCNGSIVSSTRGWRRWKSVAGRSWRSGWRMSARGSRGTPITRSSRPGGTSRPGWRCGRSNSRLPGNRMVRIRRGRQCRFIRWGRKPSAGEAGVDLRGGLSEKGGGPAFGAVSAQVRGVDRGKIRHDGLDDG